MIDQAPILLPNIENLVSVKYKEYKLSSHLKNWHIYNIPNQFMSNLPELLIQVGTKFG